jgi:hypothetical protein
MTEQASRVNTFFFVVGVASIKRHELYFRKRSDKHLTGLDRFLNASYISYVLFLGKSPAEMEIRFLGDLNPFLAVSGM